MHEVVWYRRLKMQSHTSRGVGDGQLPGMQHLPRPRAALTVNLVTQNRMTEMLEVNTNLVSASGVEMATEEGAAWELRDSEQFGCGRFAAAF